MRFSWNYFRLKLPLLMHLGIFFPFGMAAADDVHHTAREFIEAIVQSDLQGDSMPRAGRVKYSPEMSTKKALELDLPSDVVPGVFLLEMDPLVVVTSGKILNTAPQEKDEFCASIEFNVVARSEGAGLPAWNNLTHGRNFVAVNPPQLEWVTYCAVHIDHKWMLLDPPLPRVLRERIVPVLQKELQSSERRLNKIKSANENAITTIRAIRDSYARQLSAIK